jgi:predicted Zn-dependent protease
VLSGIDVAAVARALGQIAERPDDLVDAFFERYEEVELRAGDDGPGTSLRREEGLAIRLCRDDRTWLASRDGLEPRLFAEALRQVARVQPRGATVEPALRPPAWTETAAPELQAFARAVERAIRAQHAAFPLALTVRRHRRWVQVVGPRLVPAAESESYWSCAAELPWGRQGTLLPAADEASAGEFAAGLVARFRARDADPPALHRGVTVLGPAAAAVLLHEAIAHALEVDTLAVDGQPAAAIGLRLGADGLDVLDDPAGAPGSARRASDDEGTPVLRRWLLRSGVVEQPLADRLWSQRSAALLPGAGRRGSRHRPPGPRSTHLELLPGEMTEEELLADADGGLYLAAAERGALDPTTGVFTLYVPCGRRIRGGELAEAVGPCRLRGGVPNLLGGLAGVGRPARAAGAGWCAKGGSKLPVWATTPALRLQGVEVGA